MRVLIACEESQRVCIEFRKLGHEAYSCDLLPTSGKFPEWHIQGDVLEQLGKGWDMMIAFPPCTHLAVSGAAWFEQKRKDGRQQQGIDFFMQFTKTNCQRVAIENPVGVMSAFYRKPDQIINPFQFGDPVPKKTCLWLRGLPLLVPTKVVEPEFIIGKRDGKKHSLIHYMTPGKNQEERARLRSKTFPGIAKAMAEQWGKPPSLTPISNSVV